MQSIPLAEVPRRLLINVTRTACELYGNRTPISIDDVQEPSEFEILTDTILTPEQRLLTAQQAFSDISEGVALLLGRAERSRCQTVPLHTIGDAVTCTLASNTLIIAKCPWYRKWAEELRGYLPAT